MVQKSGKLTSWGNGSSFPLFPKVLYMHPTGGFHAEFLNHPTVNTSKLKTKKIQPHKGFPPTRPGDPPQFSPCFSGQPITPPRAKQTTRRPRPNIYQALLPRRSWICIFTQRKCYMTEKKTLRNAFNWGLFFFAKKIMCFLYIQEHMFRKLWKCIEILIWQSVYKEKIYSLTRKRPIRDF